MATLTGQQIDQSYQGLLKTNDNAALNATPKAIQDGTGGATNQEMSNTATNFVSGTVDFTGSTVTGDNNTTYTVSSVQDGANADIKLTDNASGESKVTLVAGTNITLSNTGNDLTINAASGGAAGLVAGTGTSAMKSDASLTTTAAIASGNQSIALGDGASATRQESVAIGQNAAANGSGSDGSIAIGNGAVASNNRAVVIGVNNSSSSSEGIAIGDDVDIAGSDRSIGIGGSITLSGGSDKVAIGTSASVSGNRGVAFGQNASATASEAVAIGYNVTAATASTVSVKALETQTDGGVQIKGDGTNAGKLKLYCEDASGAHNVTLEGPAHSGGATYALKFPNVQSAGTQILEADASGNLAWINTPGGGGAAGLEVGTGTNSLQNAVGSASTASGDQSIALGAGATASGAQSMAYGDQAQATQTSAAAFGQYAEATATYAIAFGRTSGASGDGAVAFGQQTTAAQAGAVAMGRQVTSDTADTTHVRALKIVAPDGGTGGNGITMLSPDGTAGVVTLTNASELAIDGTAIGGAEAKEGQALTPALASNAYSIPWVLDGYGTGAARNMVANSIQFIPFYANPGEAIGEFYFRIRTAQAGATMNIGLYKSYVGTMNSSKYTMPEYVGSIATGVDVSTTGKKSFTGLNITLPTDSKGGCYWIGFQSDTALVALQKWSNWVAAERVIYNDVYRGNGIDKTNATFGLPTGQIDLSTGVSGSTDLPVDFAWRYKS